MNRRNFLSAMVGGVSAAAAVRTWPFRVFSFPSEIKVASPWDSYPGLLSQPTPERFKALYVGLQIPVRHKLGASIFQASKDGDMLGRGNGSQWEAVTVYDQKELDALITKYQDTQDSGWAERMRELAPWNNVRS